MRDSISLTWRQHRKGASHAHSVERLCVRGLHRFRMYLRLPESSEPAGSFVPVRRGLQLRPELHLQGLPARERAPVGEPVMHNDTGLLVVVGSICLMLALVAWCLAGVRSSRFVKKGFPNPELAEGARRPPDDDRASVRLLSALRAAAVRAAVGRYGGAARLVTHATVHAARSPVTRASS